MRVAFVIPAHDEAAALPATLAALGAAARALLPDRHEIVVVDDASTDDTAGIARAAGARVVSIAARQIAAARNAGALAAQADALVFVDADTLVCEAALGEALTALAAGGTYGGAPVAFDEPCPRWARALLPLALAGYRRAGIAPGCFFVVDRGLFASVGGFDEGLFAAEEAVFSRALRRGGGRYFLGETPVVTSGRKLRAHSGWHLLGVMLRLGLRGKRGLRSRRGLDLWYEPTRGVS